MLHSTPISGVELCGKFDITYSTSISANRLSFTMKDGIRVVDNIASVFHFNNCGELAFSTGQFIHSKSGTRHSGRVPRYPRREPRYVLNIPTSIKCELLPFSIVFIYLIGVFDRGQSSDALAVS